MDYFSSVLSPNSNFRNSTLQILGADSLLSGYSNSKSSPILSRVLGTQRKISHGPRKRRIFSVQRVVQWLRLHASNAWDPSLISGGRTKVPHAAGQLLSLSILWPMCHS